MNGQEQKDQGKKRFQFWIQSNIVFDETCATIISSELLHT
jgi:hypothetical protein